MDEPEKPEEPKKNPRDRKAPIRDRGPRPDEKSQTFRGGRRATVRGTTGARILISDGCQGRETTLAWSLPLRQGGRQRYLG